MAANNSTNDRVRIMHEADALSAGHLRVKLWSDRVLDSMTNVQTIVGQREQIVKGMSHGPLNCRVETLVALNIISTGKEVPHDLKTLGQREDLSTEIGRLQRAIANRAATSERQSGSPADCVPQKRGPGVESAS